MDREEFNLKLDEMLTLFSKKNYKEAMNIADNIEWRRVRNVRTLCTVGEIYAANKRYEESRNIFLMAYNKSPLGKTILYRLVEVSIKMGNLDEAEEYYTDFINIAPKDSSRYVLKYKILSARKAPVEEQIEVLEEYREKEFTERWSYELVKLYYEAGMNERCIEVCDDMTIWFHEGKYVIKALELKMNIAALTPSQRRVYDEYMNISFYPGNEEIAAAKEVEESKEPEAKEEQKEEITPKEAVLKISDEEKNEEKEEIKEEPKDEKEIEEEMAAIDEEFLQQKVSQGIKDILNFEEAEEEESEEENETETEIPVLNIPKVKMSEKTKVEDLPVFDDPSFNLEKSILEAAKEQGIELEEEKASSDSKEDVIEEADKEEPKGEETEEEKPVFSEEEELIKFIDEKNKEEEIDETNIVPRENKLDEEEEKMFKYFSSVPGMKEQLAEVLKDTQMAATDKTSNSGNIIIMGNRGSGKSSLSDFIIKAICRQLKMPAAKIAKIDAKDLNDKNIPKIISKLSAGFLLIRNANQLNPETVNELNTAMEFRTDGLTVMLEDEKIGMRKFIARNPKFINKFTSTVSIPVFTNDELVNFAKVYTAENGYRIDEMGILALYSLISDNQKEDEPMTVNAVKAFVDNAIAKAESSTRKMKRNISNTRADKDGFVILYEKDFK